MTATSAPTRTEVSAPGEPEVPARSRRRGTQLEDAILSAAAAELIEVGYAGFTMEGVALRARTGKASVYRRWASKPELVLDTLTSYLPSGGHCPGEDPTALAPDTTTRDAFVIIANRMVDLLRGPAGLLVAALAGQSSRDPELARLMEAQLFEPRCDGVLDLLRRGVARGEVRPDAVNRIVASVGPSMVMHSLLAAGRLPDPGWIVEVVDQVLMPAIRPVRLPPH